MTDTGADGVKFSHDGGATWVGAGRLNHLVTGGGARPFIDQIRSFGFHPGKRDFLLVGTRDVGVFGSDDGGLNWAKVPGTEQIPNIETFFFDEFHNDVLISSFGRGLWRMLLP